METPDNALIKRQKILKQVPQLVGVLKEMKDGLDRVIFKVQDLTAKVKDKQYPTAEGISYLEAKHLLLISYCQMLVYYLLRKAEGLSIQGHPVVQSLVEMRLFLEKIRPIDKKCGYLIERLSRTSATDTVKVDDAIKGGEDAKKSEDLLKYKPRPDNLISKLGGETEPTGGAGDRGGVYKPVKILPTTMEGDGMTAKEKRNAEREEKHKVRKARQNEYYRDLIDDLDDRPKEVRERAGAESKDLAKFAAQWDKREQREEDLFNRAPMTKQEKRKLKQIQRSNGLLGLADFRDDMEALPFGDDADEPKIPRRGGSRRMEGKHNKRKRKH